MADGHPYGVRGNPGGAEGKLGWRAINDRPYQVQVFLRNTVAANVTTEPSPCPLVERIKINRVYSMHISRQIYRNQHIVIPGH